MELSPISVVEGTREEVVESIRKLPDVRLHVEIQQIKAEANQKSFQEQEIERITNRSPEELRANWEHILSVSPPPRPLPPGKTLADVLAGQWPGDETDEEILAALEELS